MSTNKVTRRVALLSSSSLGFAAFVSAVSMGVVATPTVAVAQATCTSGTTISNNGTNSVAITGANPNNPGITCAYVGDTAVVTLGTPATTVSTVAPGGGVNLTAAGDDSINWVSTAATLTGGAQTQGAVIHAQTATGNINISTGGVTGTAATVTHGVYAEATGAGDINISATTSTITATNSTSGVAGIYASSNGGDINITSSTASRAVQGRLYGVLASTNGAGALTFTGNAYVTSGASGVAALDLTTASGKLTVNLNTTQTTDNDSNAGLAAVRLTTGTGDAELNLTNRGSIQFGPSSNPNGAMVLLSMGGGTTTVNNAVNAGVTAFGSSSVSGRSAVILRASGTGNIAFHNGGLAFGAFALGSFNGGFTLNNSIPEGWSTLGTNVFSQGDDSINNLAGGGIVIGAPGPNGMSLQTTSFSFGAGEDTISNAGLIVVGENHSNNAFQIVGTTLEITGLERFNNSGLIVMGSYEPSGGGVLGAQTDGYYDDVIVMRDSHFHGDEGSRIWLDANFNNTGQTSCARNVQGLDENVSLDDPVDGRLRANDCLDFRGGGATGRTGLIIVDAIAGDRGAYNPDGNVVVDMTGSDPADVDPNAFFVAPESAGYDAAGFIDKGLFAYTVGYDPESETFRIYGVQSPSSAQFTLLGQAANDLWRTATAPWLERRVIQRNEEEGGGLTPRFWLRGSLSVGDRTVSDTVAAGAASLDYDSSYTQEDAALSMGMDLIRATTFGGDWLLGAMAGYAQARLEYDESVNSTVFEGGGVGLYSGFTAGPFFNDVVVNVTLSNLLIDMPSLNLTPAGTVLESDVHTVGAHMETGLRFSAGALRLEPLATLSWSQASFDPIDVPADDPIRFGGEVKPDDARSARAGLGLRVGLRDIAPSLIPLDAHLTARTMQELDGETEVTIVNLGPDANLARAFDGVYNELNAGVSVGQTGDHFGAFLNLGGAWGEDYDAKNGSVGLRLRW